jgi:hypothetical protein
MSTLNRSERQILRAIQEHMHTQYRRAGAAYTQVSTVGIVYHPDNTEPALNLVTPHRGVAWTRREDLQQAFDILSQRGRLPHLQYLKALFPAAFAQQLVLQGLRLERETPVWFYLPFQGPIPEGERLFGWRHDFTPLEHITAQAAATYQDFAVWLRVHQAATYGAEVLEVDPARVAALRKARPVGDYLLLTVASHGAPLAVTEVVFGDLAAQVMPPQVIWPWAGMGLEEALIQCAIELALAQGVQVIYMTGLPDHDPRLYHRLGFVLLTHQLDYVAPDSA